MGTRRIAHLTLGLESARSATDLAASVFNATLQLITFAALVRRALRAVTERARRPR